MVEYNPVTPEIINKLEITAPGRVFAGEEVNPDYARDEMPIYGVYMPEVSVDVLTTDEVSRIMKICNDHCIPVTTRGAGTGLVGGCTPVFGGVVICTKRMNKILSYNLNNFTVTVQAGVLLSELVEDALQRGFLYAPDPGEKNATLGGNVSTNAGGMRAVKYGATRDYVRAMTVVLPDGTITRFGSAVAKTSSGYSLKNLMIGSEGTLGVITELTLKLIPAPQATVSLLAPFAHLPQSIAAVPKLLSSHLNPQALEFFEKEILVASEEYLGKQVFPRIVENVEVGAYLLLTFDGSSQDELDPVIERAADLLTHHGALDILVADTAPRLKEIWSARSAFLECIEAQTKLYDECDVVVPVDKIAEYVAFVQETAKGFDFSVKLFGHAGDGNIHIFTCSNDMERDEFISRTDAFFAPIYSKTIELDGEISGEHGIGFGKIRYFDETVDKVILSLMSGIKDVFDPKRILNPGKILK